MGRRAGMRQGFASRFGGADDSGFRRLRCGALMRFSGCDFLPGKSAAAFGFSSARARHAVHWLRVVVASNPMSPMGFIGELTTQASGPPGESHSRRYRILKRRWGIITAKGPENWPGMVSVLTQKLHKELLWTRRSARFMTIRACGLPHRPPAPPCSTGMFPKARSSGTARSRSCHCISTATAPNC